MKEEIDDRTLALLALRTAQWYHMFFIQAERFLDAFEIGTEGTFPWEHDDKSSAFIGERLFFITALHHAVGDLDCMYKALKKRNENVDDIKKVMDMIATEDMLKDIKDLRNMNEHDIDYMIGNGNVQKRFSSIVEKNKYKYKTNAHMTVLIGEAQSFTVGNIQVKELIERMKSQMPKIDKICKFVFEKFME